jgi:hypothetical protein
MKRKYQYSVVACARWETQYITEWLNYYRAIGFDHVFLYCNDDDPTELFEKVLPFTQGLNPFVTFRFYPHQGEQLQMYAHFLDNDRDRSEWISFFDIDEYLRLPRDTKIDEFMAKFGDDVDCVLFNWVFFGPDGHKNSPGTSILREYRGRQQSIHPFTKYVARSKIFTGPKIRDPKEGHGFWHSPSDKVPEAFTVVNVLGEDMSRYYEGFPDTSSTFVNDPVRKDRLLATAAVHHYAFRTESAFKARVDRGLGGAFDGQTMWGDIAKGARFDDFVAGLNQIDDRSLTEFWPNFLKTANETNVFGASVPILISQRKTACQSSLCEWSKGTTIEEDANGALNGKIDGKYKFHTDIEDNPWWLVDLGELFGISEIRIFNRIDQAGTAENASRLMIEIGVGPENLVEVYRRNIDEAFGGFDGNPLIFMPSIPIPGRFVRIKLLKRTCLHLDQVQVYGSSFGIELSK